MKQPGIYKIKNTKSKKIYVGSSVNVSRRLTHHRCLLNKGRHWNRHLQASWNKYGSDSFQFGALEFCKVEDLLKMEQKWIDSLKAFGPKGYNMVPVAGSVRGRTFRHTEESKRKMSLSKKGKPQIKSPAHKEAHRIAMEKTRGRIKSEDERKKISQSKLGHVVTQETRKKISDALKRKE